MPLEVWNIQQERIGGLQVNPPDGPHEWFTVGLYGTDTGEPALGFQLHNSNERPPDGVTPEEAEAMATCCLTAPRVRDASAFSLAQRHPQVFLNAAALPGEPLVPRFCATPAVRSTPRRRTSRS